MATLTVIDRRRSKDFTQVNIYLKKELHKRLKMVCLEEDLTLSQFIEKLIEDYLETNDKS